MRVAGLQFDIVWEDRETNFARLVPWIDRVAGLGARLLVLPEMFAYGFSMATERIAEPEGGPCARFLTEHARRAGIWICGSAPERPEALARPYNSLILASPDGAVTRYRKIHPFTYADEHDHYTAGDSHVTVDVDGVRCTLFVCYDLRFADEFWVTAENTDAYVVVANWPTKRGAHWSALLTARAIENQAYVVGVNRVGRGGSLAYDGASAIVDPMGVALSSAARDETLVVAELDPERVRDTRDRFPFLRDRRRGVLKPA